MLKSYTGLIYVKVNSFRTTFNRFIYIFNVTDINQIWFGFNIFCQERRKLNISFTIQVNKNVKI